MRQGICTAAGAVGSAIAGAFGGWDQGMITLVFFMAVDYISGLVVAGVFHASKKTDTGSLKSEIGWKGIAKKCMTLLFVIVAHRLDVTLRISYVRDAVIIAFITNELISITENAGLMGIPMPKPISKAIDMLTKRGEEDGKERSEKSH